VLYKVPFWYTLYMKITIHTDGSSRGNPGPGGWAAVLVTEHKPLALGSQPLATQEYDDEVIELGGREDLTTNNRMELMGAIMGLMEIDGRLKTVDGSQLDADADTDSESLQSTSYGLKSVEVCTDSQYVKKGMTEWIDGWIRKGWIGSTKKPVLNRDLWEMLKKEEDRLKKSGVKIIWTYVKAHVGIVMNERADTIATMCADDAKDLQLYRGPKSEYTV
jgi:ribonuclease HI